MLIQNLCNLYDQLIDPPKMGQCYGKTHYAIVLDKEGNLKQITDLKPFGNGYDYIQKLPWYCDVSGKLSHEYPKFLWGGFKVLKESKYFKHFKMFVEDIYSQCDDEGLKSVVNFLNNVDINEVNSYFSNKKYLKENFVFEYNGEFVHDRQKVKNFWLEYYYENYIKTLNKGTCLLSGNYDYIVKKHGPTISYGNGVRLASFNDQVYNYLGKSKGNIAPCGATFVHKYSIALEWLNVNRQYVNVGDNKLYFWTDTRPELGKELVSIFGMYLDNEQEQDEEEIRKTKEIINYVKRGNDVSNLQLPDTNVNILTTKFKLGRISVLGYQRESLEKIYKNVLQHYKDTYVGQEKLNTTNINNIVKNTLTEDQRNRKDWYEKISRFLVERLFYSMLNNKKYPNELYNQIMLRIRAETGTLNETRVGFLNGYYKRRGECMNEYYELGKLFKLLENLQRAATGGELSTRFFASAMATPRNIFPELLKRGDYHIEKMKKGEKVGLAIWYNNKITEVCDNLGDDFPKRIPQSEQGKFVLGYRKTMKDKEEENE
ncbi:MAG: type I-C CRISPR-associated protein Cas8c/Csd1 [bacterium]